MKLWRIPLLLCFHASLVPAEEYMGPRSLPNSFVTTHATPVVAKQSPVEQLFAHGVPKMSRLADVKPSKFIASLYGVPEKNLQLEELFKKIKGIVDANMNQQNLGQSGTEDQNQEINLSKRGRQRGRSRLELIMSRHPDYAKFLSQYVKRRSRVSDRDRHR